MLLDDRLFLLECVLVNRPITIEVQSQTVQMESIEYFIPKSNYFIETSGACHRPLLVR